MGFVEGYHVPVLQTEVADFLVTDPGGTYVDGTLGGAGHAMEVCRRLSQEGRLIGFDVDTDALRHSRETLMSFGKRVTLLHANFRALQSELHAIGVTSLQGMLLDLGVSSFQLDTSPRGFSYRSDGPLDMRMNPSAEKSAWTVVNMYEEADLAKILYRYGEERHARRIARRLVVKRPIGTTTQLRESIASVVGGKFLTKSLARVFQAIRIEVNDELAGLQEALPAAVSMLVPGGRLVVISYHSLEDRIVKDFLRFHATARVPSGSPYLPDVEMTPTLRILTKRPVVPDEEETKRNPRARSAKLRAAERMSVS